MPAILEQFQRYDTIDKIFAELEKAQSGGRASGSDVR